MGIRAKYAESSQFLELKSYQLDCCCTEALQAWWDHYEGRFGAIEATYKKMFEGCPFRWELGKREKQALLTQIAEDNKLPMIGKKSSYLSGLVFTLSFIF